MGAMGTMYVGSFYGAYGAYLAPYIAIGSI
jgi:hypothetical protein